MGVLVGDCAFLGTRVYAGLYRFMKEALPL